MKASKLERFCLILFFSLSLSLSFSLLFLLKCLHVNYTSLLYYTTTCIDGTDGPTYMNLLLLLPPLLYLQNV